MCERPQPGIGGIHPPSLLPASPASIDGRVSCLHLRCATRSINAYGYRSSSNCWNDGIEGLFRLFIYPVIWVVPTQ
jgi:hypothetical protein